MVRFRPTSQTTWARKLQAINVRNAGMTVRISGSLWLLPNPIRIWDANWLLVKADKRRSHQIAHSPDLLVLQLMRFNAGIMGNVSKDNTPVSFSTTLDLNSYRSQHNTHTSTYQLIAVVMHAGGSGFGHYTCSAKGGDGEWYHFDDSSVSKINANRAINPGNGWSPYLLFFLRDK